jgi:glycosyltransferase involved in cell wall biosynthesis
MWPVIKRASVFLRPTTSDGDSISLREALHFNVPVVASDAAPRPAGSILFASRDQAEFNSAISTALQSGEVPCS